MSQLDRARALRALGRHDDAAAQLAEARAGAERIGARALAAGADPAAATIAP